ncbi:uncharacterized protein G2W53_028932 [Senna tora]|uniref:Uncharacterized protein n=1 Tax=Senna tora TaxID=362788 RepID=A0A834T4B6_9FABA|nr:uncharacterized protein G2W53_028932 [Senna tora]
MRPGDWQGIEIPEILNPRNQASRLGDWQGIERLSLTHPSGIPGGLEPRVSNHDWLMVLLPATSTNRLSLLLETHDCLDCHLKPYSKFIFVPTLRAILKFPSALMKGNSLKSRDSNVFSFI